MDMEFSCIDRFEILKQGHFMSGIKNGGGGFNIVKSSDYKQQHLTFL